jgi:hypothetical protein
MVEDELLAKAELFQALLSDYLMRAKSSRDLTPTAMAIDASPPAREQ